MIITQTPLRISFLGGNTDFPDYYLNYGGMVLTTTIDKYIYCIVKKRFDNQIIVNYTIKEAVRDIKYLKHDLVREALKMLEITSGIEISFLSDIPTEGSGLGSSSAVTIGVLNALHNYKGDTVSSRQLASEAIKIELKILEKHIGVQDQHAIALGGLRRIEFMPSGMVEGKRVILADSIKEDLNNSLMLFYTGITRKAEDILSTLKFTKDKALLDQNKVFAEEGAIALIKGDLKKFGQLLDAYWEVKKQLSTKITNTEIDSMYKLAKKAGAIGGKVIGAGGGGFLLVMFPANKRTKIREALKDYKELPFRFSDAGSRVIFQI